MRYRVGRRWDAHQRPHQAQGLAVCGRESCCHCGHRTSQALAIEDAREAAGKVEVCFLANAQGRFGALHDGHHQPAVAVGQTVTRQVNPGAGKPQRAQLGGQPVEEPVHVVAVAVNQQH